MPKKFKENLQILTEELKEARNNEEFFENDLKQSKKKLNQNLTMSLNINIPFFISKIKLNHNRIILTINWKSKYYRKWFSYYS